jgi:hypothetical protein
MKAVYQHLQEIEQWTVLVAIDYLKAEWAALRVGSGISVPCISGETVERSVGCGFKKEWAESVIHWCGGKVARYGIAHADGSTEWKENAEGIAVPRSISTVIHGSLPVTSHDFGELEWECNLEVLTLLSSSAARAPDQVVVGTVLTLRRVVGVIPELTLGLRKEIRERWPTVWCPRSRDS